MGSQCLVLIPSMLGFSLWKGLCEPVLYGKVVTGIGYLSCDGDDGMNV